MGVSQSKAQSAIPGNEAAGRWDITIDTPNGEQPSWLEIETSGVSALVGQYVGPSGSARPVSEIKFSEETGTYSFTTRRNRTNRKMNFHVILFT